MKTMTTEATGQASAHAPRTNDAATPGPGLPSPVEEVHDDRGVPPTPTHSTEVLTAAGDLLRSLAAPVRIAIVLQLRDSARCVHELVEALGVAQPLISQHLRVLKATGVVYGERHGREVMYRLVDDHLAHIVVDAVSHAQEHL